MTTIFDASATADEVLAGINLQGKHFLITGVSAGIGRETARALLARGATVTGTVRDLAKAEPSSLLLQETASRGGGRLQLAELNLASLQSVRKLAAQLLASALPLDVIIANAGVMATPAGRTADGFETQLGTNHLGHFALVTAIEPLLADHGRLIVLSSQAHRAADVDLADPHFDQQPYDPFVAYGRSKTANALFAAAFDSRYRHRGVRAAAVMPGNSLTDLPRHFSPEALQGLLEFVANARAEAGLPAAVLKDIGQAAATSVWAAVVADKEQIGGRYLEDCAIAAIDDSANPFADGVKSYALDPARAHALWLKSAAMILAV